MSKEKWKLKCRKGGAIIMMMALFLGSVDSGMANVFASTAEPTEVTQENESQTEVTQEKESQTEVIQEKESQPEAESSQSESSGTEKCSNCYL